MPIRTTRLYRVELTVADLPRAEQFYVGALGFEFVSRDEAEPAVAALYGAQRVQEVALRRGGQTLVLQRFQPEGSSYPAGALACDGVFQHFALPVAEMGPAFARLAPFGAAPISSGGPQHLPERSGGATAYKFRDPDGHPLELIQFPQGGGDGIDHSAIAVADTERSIAFYRDRLGFTVGARQVNSGETQDRLDGVSAARVDVVALQPVQAAPHVELLGYQAPPGRPAPRLRPCDVAATRLVLEVTELPDPAVTLADGSRAVVLPDPDGHLLVLVERPQG